MVVNAVRALELRIRRLLDILLKGLQQRLNRICHVHLYIAHHDPDAYSCTSDQRVLVRISAVVGVVHSHYQ